MSFFNPLSSIPMDDSQHRLPLSLIVITHNEAKTLASCLNSVNFAAEKIVIDCGSTDDTVAIAKANGARVIHQDWLGFGLQRQFATSQASFDWILMLDADESLSAALHAECLTRLPALMVERQLSVVRLRRQAWYMGQPMRWYRPMRNERIGRIYHRQRAHWNSVRVHESLLSNGKSTELHAPLFHQQSATLVHKQLKVLRYAELKALDWKSAHRPLRMWQCPFVYCAAFFKDYIVRLAMLDGWRGFIVAQIAANYAVYKRMRYYEMVFNPDSVSLAHTHLCKHNLEHE